MNNAAKEKARQPRYKNAALARLNLDTIRDELSKISENCDNVRYFIEKDIEILLAALDGDEEEEYEFKMMIEDAPAVDVVEVVRCNNCKWLSKDTECKICQDIDEPCGYCLYFGACVRDDGYCYHGERS